MCQVNVNNNETDMLCNDMDAFLFNFLNSQDLEEPLTTKFDLTDFIRKHDYIDVIPTAE